MSHHLFQKYKLFIYTAGSVIAHLTLFCLLFLTVKTENKKGKSELVEISFVEADLPDLKIPDPTAIVETDSREANNELSESARFLSEKSNTVKKETKAKTGEKFLNAKKTSVAMAKQETKQEKTSGKKAQAKQKAASAKAEIFDNSFNAFSSLSKKESEKQNKPSSTSELSSTSNDNLEKIESDLMTRLNTKEYRYFGYYSRIKTQLNQWWVPKVQQKFTKMMRQGRTIASEENKITKLVIVLDITGHLVKVQVLGESGIKDLDDAAIEAFRSAAPFPNPPKGMVDKDGLVKIRWDCVVES